jgi:hypothetical protein
MPTYAEADFPAYGALLRDFHFSHMTTSHLAPQFVSSSEIPSPAQWRGPLFVAGTWRSGTSLLYVLLNKHPQIALLYEGDLFLLRPLFRIPGAASRWPARWEFWNGALKRHGLDTGRIPLTVSRLPTAMEKAYQEYARQKGALIWGEKSVHFHHSLERLVEGFPDARFIFLWRDLAAICSSVIRAKNDFFLGRSRMTERTLDRYKTLKVQCDRLVSRGVPVHQIHYETLVKDPAAVMADVCKFLDVPFVPSIAFLEGADRSAIYEGRHHSLVRSERIVSSLERSEVLTPDLKRKIERYISLWQEESGGKWPILSPPQNGDSGKPSLRERLFDRALYRCLRTYDSMVVFIYCFAPLWLLKGYRAYKRRVLHQNSWEHSGSGK